MSLDGRLSSYFSDVTEARKDIREMSELLRRGGGGGTSGGMEARVAKLESDVGHLLTAVGEIKAAQLVSSKDLTELKVSSGKVETKVSSLPTKEDIAKTIKDWLLLMGAALTVINLAALIISRYLPSA